MDDELKDILSDNEDDDGYFDGPCGKAIMVFILLATLFALAFGVGYGVAELDQAVEVKVCGTQVNKPDLAPTKDGKKVISGNWPWHVAIYKLDEFICSGALIEKKWVVTTASCIFNSKQSDLTAWFGKESLNSLETNEQYGYVVKAINTYWTFDGESGEPRENDVAVLELQTNVELNDHVNTVCLPKTGTNVTNFGDTCYVTGYRGGDTQGSR
ncbi:chymotrypsin-like elastase family member 2A isoform X2 [Glandiceps talaboti]